MRKQSSYGMGVIGLHRQLTTRQSPTRCGKASRYTVVGLITYLPHLP